MQVVHLLLFAFFSTVVCESTPVVWHGIPPGNTPVSRAPSGAGYGQARPDAQTLRRTLTHEDGRPDMGVEMLPNPTDGSPNVDPTPYPTLSPTYYPTHDLEEEEEDGFSFGSARLMFVMPVLFVFVIVAHAYRRRRLVALQRMHQQHAIPPAFQSFQMQSMNQHQPITPVATAVPVTPGQHALPIAQGQPVLATCVTGTCATATVVHAQAIGAPPTVIAGVPVSNVTSFHA